MNGPPTRSRHRPFLLGVAGGTGSGKTTVAERLAAMFVKNFDQYAGDVRPEILTAGPRATASLNDESLAFIEE